LGQNVEAECCAREGSGPCRDRRPGRTDRCIGSTWSASTEHPAAPGLREFRTGGPDRQRRPCDHKHQAHGCHDLSWKEAASAATKGVKHEAEQDPTPAALLNAGWLSALTRMRRGRAVRCAACALFQLLYETCKFYVTNARSRSIACHLTSKPLRADPPNWWWPRGARANAAQRSMPKPIRTQQRWPPSCNRMRGLRGFLPPTFLAPCVRQAKLS